MRKLFAFVLSAMAVLSVVGCNGGVDDILGQNDPDVRVFNALRTDTPIRATIGGQEIGGTVQRGNASGEIKVAPGTYNLQVTNANNGNVLVNMPDKLLETRSNYVLVAFESDTTYDGIAGRLIRENEDTTAGRSEITFVLASHAFGAVDIYLVPLGQGLPEAVATTRLGTTNSDDTVFTVDPGTYTVRVYPAGSTDAELFRQEVTVEGSANYMMIISSQGTGAPFNGVVYNYRER